MGPSVEDYKEIISSIRMLFKILIFTFVYFRTTYTFLGGVSIKINKNLENKQKSDSILLIILSLDLLVITVTSMLLNEQFLSILLIFMSLVGVALTDNYISEKGLESKFFLE